MKKTSRVAAKKGKEPPKISVYPRVVRFHTSISLPGQNEPSTKQINMDRDPTLIVQVLDDRINIRHSGIEGVMVEIPRSNIAQITWKTVE
jgi:hypothetical protein